MSKVSLSNRYWCDSIHVAQQIQVKNPEINPWLYGQLVPRMSNETMDNLFNKQCKKNWTSIAVNETSTQNGLKTKLKPELKPTYPTKDQNIEYIKKRQNP